MNRRTSLKTNNHRKRQKALKKRSKPESDDSEMIIEEEDSKTLVETRRRRSTLDCLSPTNRLKRPNLFEIEKEKSAFKSISKYYTGIKPKTESQIIDQIYFDQVFSKLDGFRFGDFLYVHQTEPKFRVKMIDWMIEVLTIYKQNIATLFKALFILDLYYDSKKTAISIAELHLNGIVCMLIASKQEEVRPIKLGAMIETVGRGKFSKQMIKDKEVDILCTINFRTNFPTIYELLSCTFRFVTFNKPETEKLFRKSAFLLSKMCVFSYELTVELSLKEISLYSTIIAIKLCQNVESFDCDVYMRDILELYGVKEDTILKRKLKLIHTYSLNFSSIMPYVRNLESICDFFGKEGFR